MKIKKYTLKKLIYSIWGIYLGSIILICFLFFLSYKSYLGYIPNVRDLENPDINTPSEIISSDLVVIDKFEDERRTIVKYEDLPNHLVDALLAKEDIRFFDHNGVDIKATLRAIFSIGELGGGSTITQQLSKQLYTVNPSNNKILRVFQKIKEWITAVQIERLYTKEEIIAMYFNKFDFIYGAKGIESASKVYFNKSVKDLNIEESATLVAMFQNPVLYNPIKNPDLSIKKRNFIIEKMYRYGKINKLEYVNCLAKPLIVNKKNDINREYHIYSGYFKPFLKKQVKDILYNYEKNTGIKYDLEKDGLKVYVTLDSRLQNMAYKAIKSHLSILQNDFFKEHRNRKLAPFYNISKSKRDKILYTAIKRTDLYKKLKLYGKSDADILNYFNTSRKNMNFFSWSGVKSVNNKTLMDSIIYHKHILQSGLISIDPKDGAIRAWIGGVDWNYFKFDHVKQSKRQVGSTFKPFVYATAINQLGLSPCYMISNDPIEGNWSPRNFNGKYGGYQSLRTAIANSTNVVAARLIMLTGVRPVIKLVRDLGIDSYIANNYTIALGSADISLYEMVSAMSTFANQGIYVKPQLVFKIEDRYGRLIYNFEFKYKEVLSEYVAYTMIDLLKGVVDRGSASKIRYKYGLNSEIAGKTGTTNENSDGWFIGLTPNLVTGVWVGGEDRFTHFNGNKGQGANTALPIWAKYMKYIYSDNNLNIKNSDYFIRPKDIEKKWDCENYYINKHNKDSINSDSIKNSSSNNKSTLDDKIRQFIDKIIDKD